MTKEDVRVTGTLAEIGFEFDEPPDRRLATRGILGGITGFLARCGFIEREDVSSNPQTSGGPVRAMVTEELIERVEYYKGRVLEIQDGRVEWLER
jgi:hypothetical protein